MISRSRRRLRVAACAGLALSLTASLAGCSNPLDHSAAANVGTVAPAPGARPTAAAQAAPVRAAGFPAVSLAPGQKPPQFIVISFDGGGSIDRWKYYRQIASAVGAHLTYYLSGTYLLPPGSANLYDPPHHKRGASDIGFADSGSDIVDRMDQVRQAYLDGNEIGTHFNGHFCGRTGVQAWSSADWASELSQWYGFLDNWRTNANAPNAAGMPFDHSAIIGERTPCLEGHWSALFPVLRAHGFRYDTSDYGYLQWPKKNPSGLWEIPLQELRAAQTGVPVLSMDWNFYDMQTHAIDGSPGLRDSYGQQELQTYRNAYRAVLNGNRAPLILGGHFMDWNSGVYTRAMGQFIKETCGQPDTHCVTFTELINWMEAQTPETLAALQALPIQTMTK